jgi:adenosylmethionine-8-amino-7-oxononanoate aminotransferase
MVGIELVRDRDTREPFDPADRVGHLVCMAARKYGVILRPLGDVIVLMPPLSISTDELDLLIGVLGRCIVEVTGD